MRPTRGAIGPDGRSEPRLRPLPVGAVLGCGLLGAVLTSALVLLNLRVKEQPLTSVLTPGRESPAAPVIRRDFPKAPLLHSGGNDKGNDGQYFYVVARSPFEPEETAEHIDRPRYRLQRILYPLLAWAAHPGGGGTGLVVALLAVNAFGVFLGCAAVAGFAASRGRTPRWGLAYCLVPGTFVAMRISTADGLAAGLALLALLLLEREKRLEATIAATAAALTKETALLVVLGGGGALWLLRREVPVAFLALPVAGVVAWWSALRVLVPRVTTAEVTEFRRPLEGIVGAVDVWRFERDVGSAAVFVLAVALAAVALARARRGYFALPIALQLALLLVLSDQTLVSQESAPRTLLPLTSLAITSLICGGGGPLHVDAEGHTPPARPGA